MPEVKKVRFYVDLMPFIERLQNGEQIILELNPGYVEDASPPDGYPLPEGYQVILNLELLQVKPK